MKNWNRPYLRKNVQYVKTWPGKVAETLFTDQANVHQEAPTKYYSIWKSMPYNYYGHVLSKSIIKERTTGTCTDLHSHW